MSQRVNCAKLRETLTLKKSHDTLKEQCDAFLFGDGGSLPPDFVSEKH